MVDEVNDEHGQQDRGSDGVAGETSFGGHGIGGELAHRPRAGREAAPGRGCL